MACFHLVQSFGCLPVKLAAFFEKAVFFEIYLLDVWSYLWVLFTPLEGLRRVNQASLTGTRLIKGLPLKAAPIGFWSLDCNCRYSLRLSLPKKNIKK